MPVLARVCVCVCARARVCVAAAHLLLTLLFLLYTRPQIILETVHSSSKQDEKFG